MNTDLPDTEEKIRAAFPHLRHTHDIKHERINRFRDRGKVPNQSTNSDRLATMTNMRSHLKVMFPKQVFKVEPYSHLSVFVSWTKWEPPFGDSPTEKEVSDALDLFRHWPLDTSKNESRPKENLRRQFQKIFGGAQNVSIRADAPTSIQMARKQKTMLRKISRQSQPVEVNSHQTKRGPKL